MTSRARVPPRRATARTRPRRKRIGSDHVSDKDASSETHIPSWRGRDAGAAVPGFDGAGTERAGDIAGQVQDAAGHDLRAARVGSDLLGRLRSERSADGRSQYRTRLHSSATRTVAG